MNFNFIELEKKYQNDAGFNAMVRCFKNLIEHHGFMPSEIREGLFFAQYAFEMGKAETIVKSEHEWEQIAKMREILKAEFARNYE